MKLVAWLFGFGIAVSAAGAQVSNTASLPDPLAPIAWMAGGVWHGKVTAPNGAAMMIATHVERVLGGAAMHFGTSFGGTPTYEGVFAYDAVRKAIVFSYAAADGGYTSGTVTPGPEFLTWDFDVHEKDGSSGHYQVHAHQDGKDDYTWSLFAPDAGGWKPVLQVKYHRDAA